MDRIGINKLFSDDNEFSFIPFFGLKGQENKKGSTEFTLFKYPLKKVVEMVSNGEIAHAGSVVAIVKARNYLEGQKKSLGIDNKLRKKRFWLALGKFSTASAVKSKWTELASFLEFFLIKLVVNAGNNPGVSFRGRNSCSRF